jgi:membrane protein implicated in regulation of membrane protease activity
MNWAAIIWAGLIVVFLIVEAACPIHLVSLWFAAGALVAAIAAWLSAPIWLQLVLFVLVSGALLACLWPLVRKYLNPKVTATNIDSVIGSIGLVTAAIDNIAAEGQVKLNGMVWTARSTNGSVIPAGTKVRVDRIEGVKVYVSPAEVSASI